MFYNKRLFFLLSLFFIGCTSFTAPEGSYQVEATAQWITWWDEVEQCSGRSRSITDIDWWIVPGDCIEKISEGCVAGEYIGNSIYLSESWSTVEGIVKHEIAHALGGEHEDDWLRICGTEGKNSFNESR